MCQENTLRDMAERTGLEPAAPGVTGPFSNQLNCRWFPELWSVCSGRYDIKSGGLHRFITQTFKP